MNTRIDFLLIYLSVSDDHTAYLRIICIQSAGKHSGSSYLCFLTVSRFPHKFLVDNCIILIHPAFTELAQSKFSHALPVALISLRITFFLSDDAGIKICALRISKCIVVISKIHKKRLRQCSSVRGIQCFHIIFIQSCDTDSPIHSLGKPAEIFCPSRISLHNVFTDSLNCIILRECLASHDHGTVKALIKCFLVT